jgi:hypothetical protein
MLNAIMVNDIMLNVVMLNVFMFSIVALLIIEGTTEKVMKLLMPIKSIYIKNHF